VHVEDLVTASFDFRASANRAPCPSKLSLPQDVSQPPPIVSTPVLPLGNPTHRPLRAPLVRSLARPPPPIDTSEGQKCVDKVTFSWTTSQKTLTFPQMTRLKHLVQPHVLHGSQAAVNENRCGLPMLGSQKPYRCGGAEVQAQQSLASWSHRLRADGLEFVTFLDFVCSSRAIMTLAHTDHATDRAGRCPDESLHVEPRVSH
jgi:hypothetical protein